MYVLRWIYRNTIPEYNNTPGELMQHLYANAILAYNKRKNDSRYEGLKVMWHDSGNWTDVTDVFNKQK